MLDIANSNLIVGNALAVDEWTRVELPASEEVVRKRLSVYQSQTRPPTSRRKARFWYRW